MTDSENQLVARARAGDRDALEALVAAMQDLVYNLAVRMLNSTTDAEDMTQEILLKLVTSLGSFRGESTFRTWAYRVASNHLLTARKRAAEERGVSFESMQERLESGFTAPDPPVEDQMVLREAKLICTTMMLSCLDRDHRIAFILGEVLELPSEEGAAVLEISDDAFRKRVSRARARMEAFMKPTCDLVDSANPCTCGKIAAKGLKLGFIDPKHLVWANRPVKPSAARVADIDGISRAVAVFRGHPDYATPTAVVEGVKRALKARTSDLLE